MRKETYKSISFINTDAEIINKIQPVESSHFQQEWWSLVTHQVPWLVAASLRSLPPSPHHLPFCIWCLIPLSITLVLVIVFGAKSKIISSQDPSLDYTYRLFFQIRSCLQVLGVRTWTYLFGSQCLTNYLEIMTFMIFFSNPQIIFLALLYQPGPAV